MRSSIFKSEAALLLVLSLLPFFCSKTDYYAEIRKECNATKAEALFIEFTDTNNPAIIKVIEAMADCRSQEMDRFLSERYSLSDQRIKGYIYQNLIRNRSRYFVDTMVDIIINRVETQEDYSQVLSDLNAIDQDVLNKKYEEFVELLKKARRDRNRLAVEIYLDKVRSLSKVLKKEFNENEIKDDIRSIREKNTKEDLYTKFLDATNNQEMERAYKIYSRLTEKGLVENNSSHIRLISLLRELSRIEQEFYTTAHRQDLLMIDIEKAKREGNREEMKRLQSKLNSVKSDMVFKKRALDRATKRLVTVRDLFSKVKKK